MNQSLMKTIQLSMTKDELEKIDLKIVEKLLFKLQNLYVSSTMTNYYETSDNEDEENTSKNKVQSELKEFEGNVWAAISRMEDKHHNAGIYSRQVTEVPDNSPLKRQKFKIGQGLLNFVQSKLATKKNFNPNMSFKRQGTYMNKKRNMLENCFGGETKHFGEGIKPNKEAAKDGEISPSKKQALRSVAEIFYLQINQDKEAAKMRRDRNVRKFITILKNRIANSHNTIKEEKNEDSEGESEEFSAGSEKSEKTENNVRNQAAPTIKVDSTWEMKQTTKEILSSSDFSESSSEEEKEIKFNKLEERKEEDLDPFQAAMKKINLKSKTVRFQNDEDPHNLLEEKKKVAYTLKIHDQMILYFASVLIQ